LNIECTYSASNAGKTNSTNTKKRKLSSTVPDIKTEFPQDDRVAGLSSDTSTAKLLMEDVQNGNQNAGSISVNNFNAFDTTGLKLENFNNSNSNLDIPQFTLKSMASSIPMNIAQHLSNMSPANIAQLRASMFSESSPMFSRDSNNNPSINMSSLSNNPTISPQPSMSAGSATSPLSTHQQMHDDSRHKNVFTGHTNNNNNNNNTNNNNNNNQHSSDQADLNTNVSPYAAPKNLNLTDLRLMYHYTTVVAPTITSAGISEKRIWMSDIPQLAFDYPFLMHSILAFSATHLSRTTKSLEESLTYHRGEALRLLREAVLEISAENTDALVASALILIMDSLANASLPSSSSPTSLPASAWIFHVKGAATILTAVWPLPPTSRFHQFISVDLGDLGDIINEGSGSISELVCFDESIADLYPVEYDSPYLITLAYLDKLHFEKDKSDFILRIFAFPALLDKTFLALLMSGDLSAMRIMRSYYSLLRGFTTEMKDKVWFLEGVSQVLPADVDDYTGGGGMHMMLDFLGGGLPSMTTTNLAPGLNIDINDHFMNP
jgi:hypothetical protein